MAHEDSDPVTVSYASSKNISFHGKGIETGYTWGDWREMSQADRDAAIDDVVWDLIEISVDGDKS